MTLLTGLPLIWPEGDAVELLAPDTAAPPMRAALERALTIRPLDTLDARTLGTAIAIVAQPRRLAPAELATLDGWVRRGGRALIFADAELRWPSRWPPGDPRRPPPVTLLDPLFAHWGIALGDPVATPVTVKHDGEDATLSTAARWQAPGCAPPRGYVVDCRIGAGRVILVGDADVLAEPRHAPWLIALVATLDAGAGLQVTRSFPTAQSRTGIEQSHAEP